MRAAPARAPAKQRRFAEAPTVGRPHALPHDHVAMRTMRTLFPSTVTDPAFADHVLVSGVNSRKIGGVVTKGAWAGMPIYTLTLEERRTCPASCRNLACCYMNHSQWARRLAHGPALIERLGTELVLLAAEHEAGFVVRLHVAGDFYSVAYVRQWLSWLRRIPQLRVFGYTHHRIGTPIGDLIRGAAARWWDRFAIRTSSNTLPIRAAETVATPDLARSGSVICPAQTGQTECCSSCALCWGTQRNIAFLVH